MQKKTVTKACILPGSQEEIWEKLKELKTLQYIAAPLAKFLPLSYLDGSVWSKDKSFSLRLYLFGFLPLGVHTIHIADFDDHLHRVYSNETNQYIPVWNHLIMLEPIEPGKTHYTDEIEIAVGWKTPLVCLWAKFFYAHRQKKWKKLLEQSRI